MISFDFISDDDFRLGLESDCNEMLSAIQHSAYKSVHILAGSIVEAILIDTLIASGCVSKQNGLRMSLADAIAVAREKGIISETTAALSSVVKEYRNLIHPGRAIRLQETPTAESAQVAKALVAMVARDVEGWKQRNYGYTAQQIVSKLERDSSAVTIIFHILAEARPSEIERLLLVILPNAYLRASAAEETPDHVLSAYIQCYRTAFEQAPKALKKKVMDKFVKMLKEESDSIILPYEIAFVRGSDLQYLPQSDAQLVADHLVGRMQTGVTEPLLEALEGIGTFLTESSVNRFVDPLVKAVLRSSDSNLRRLARNRLVSEWYRMPSVIDNLTKARLDAWIDLYRGQDQVGYVEILEEIKAEREEIPF
ncbi:MAG: hypothetical protein N2V78_02340 [Methanophagales archaeon]|nr:hypothetical protein [Methanophagales archaeon]